MAPCLNLAAVAVSVAACGSFGWSWIQEREKLIRELRERLQKHEGMACRRPLGPIKENESTSEGRPIQEENLEAALLSVDGLKKRFLTWPPSDAETLIRLADLLLAGTGGGMWVVIDRKLKDTIPFSLQDDGKLYRCFATEVGRNGVVTKTARFAAIVRALCKHTKSDRWERHELELLAAELGHSSLEAASAAHIQALLEPEPQPKDGAVLISFSGTVLSAAARIRASPPKGLGRQLLRADGTRAGTKHASATDAAQYLCHLDAAQYLCQVGASGVIFTRSDEGSVHVFFPRKSSVAEVYKVVR